MSLAHESIDERRYQVTHIFFTVYVWAQLPLNGDESDFWRCTLFALQYPPALQSVGAEIKDLSLRVLQHTMRDSGGRLVVVA